MICGLGIQTETFAGFGPACSTRSLRGGRFGHRRRRQRLDVGRGIERPNFDEAAVDDEDDPCHRHRGFSDVGRHDYLSGVFWGGLEDVKLLVAWETGVER